LCETLANRRQRLTVLIVSPTIDYAVSFELTGVKQAAANRRKNWRFLHTVISIEELGDGNRKTYIIDINPGHLIGTYANHIPEPVYDGTTAVTWIYGGVGLQIIDSVLCSSR